MGLIIAVKVVDSLGQQPALSNIVERLPNAIIYNETVKIVCTPADHSKLKDGVLLVLDGETEDALLTLVKRLRVQTDRLIVVISTNSDSEHEIQTLKSGVDVFALATQDIRCIAMRIYNAYARLGVNLRPLDSDVPSFELNQNDNTVSWKGKNVRLTPKLFQLLLTLKSRPHFVFSRRHLLDIVYEDNLEVEFRSIDGGIARIKRLLASIDIPKSAIVSVHGLGYKYDPNALRETK